MQSDFEDLSRQALASVKSDEVLLLNYRGESSDFVRFNTGKVRQAGSVADRALSLTLMREGRQASGGVTLSGDGGEDVRRAERLLETLRADLPNVPEDPYLIYEESGASSETVRSSELPPADEAISAVMDTGHEVVRADSGSAADLVGIYAAGGIHAGFANSLGQRNWFSTHTFNLDWSLYHQGDKAVKANYAGFAFDPEELSRRMTRAGRQLSAIRRTPRTVAPGAYRAYLAPAAISSIMDLLSWGGFGLKSLKTRTSPLVLLADGSRALNPGVTLRENIAAGAAPDFQGQGFRKPGTVDLIASGQHVGSLISPRSAKEFGVETNGADAGETPVALEMGAGELAQADMVQTLETGLYIGNLWYLNYSDRSTCGATGMTRFATFWVEDGEVVAPLNTMRFKDSLLDVFGSKLVGLTAERDWILDPGTYGGRSTSSRCLPGALIEDFALSL